MLCAREREWVCVLISMTFLSKVFYVQHVVFCKNAFWTVQAVEFLLYIGTCAGFWNRQWNADYAPASDKRLMAWNKSTFTFIKPRGARSEQEQRGDVGNLCVIVSFCTLLTVRRIGRNCMWLHPWVLSEEESGSKLRRSQRHQSDANCRQSVALFARARARFGSLSRGVCSSLVAPILICCVSFTVGDNAACYEVKVCDLL